MKQAPKKYNLKECKYVDLKLRTRDPKVRQISNFFCEQIELLAPKRTRSETIKQAKYAVRGILADLFRAREAGNAVAAVSLSEGRYSSKHHGPVRYKPLRLAIDSLVSSQTLLEERLPPLVLRFKGFGNSKTYKDNTKLALNEEALSMWFAAFENQKERRGSVSNLVHLSSDLLKSVIVEEVTGELEASVIKHQCKEHNDLKIVRYNDINQYISEEAVAPITSRLNYIYYSAEPRSVISLRDDAGLRVSYDQTPELARMSEDVRNYNEYLGKHVVQLFLCDAEFDELLTRTKLKLSSKRRVGDFARTRSQILQREQPGVYRVFNRGSFEAGGRHYGGYWQNIPKEYRAFLTINGHPTVELDFKSMHPTMIYHLLKLPIEGDPYELEGFPPGYRDTAKSAFMTLLNAKQNARRLRSLETLAYPPGWSRHSLREAIESRHAPIRGVFRSDMGVKLQRLDSDIAAIVMRIMRERHGTLVLSVHDSFIVPEDQEANLRAAMLEAYDTVMGSPAIGIDRKPTIFESLKDLGENGKPAQLLRYVEGMLDEHDTHLVVDQILSRVPLASSYQRYLSSFPQVQMLTCNAATPIQPTDVTSAVLGWSY